jgi:AhpC/TSA family
MTALLGLCAVGCAIVQARLNRCVKRHWNWSLWLGFLVVLVAFFSYEFFVLFPVTRDFPWVNLLLFALGGILLLIGLFRAYGQPTVYRGKVFGPVLALVGVVLFALFSYGLFYIARQMPLSAGAPRVGEPAPDFTLPDQDGRATALRDFLASSGTRAVLLIFYRGYW